MKKLKIENILLIGSFLFLTFLGICLSYNYEIKENYNLIFDSDTARVIGDATEIAAEHYRADVHPLFIILVQPVVFLLSGIVLNKMIAIILLSAFVSSLSVYFIYKTLNLIKVDKKVNLLLSIIYLFSFSNIIFTTGIETYNFAALFLIMMWYYFIRKENEKYNVYSYAILILFGILNFAFTITNIIVYLIVILILWVMKKLNIKNIFIIGIITIGLVLGLNITQRLIWHNASVVWNISMSNEQNFVNENKFGKNNFKNVLVNDYYNSWISNDIEMSFQYGNKYNGQNFIIRHQNMNLLNFLIISSFYILLIFLIARNFKKKKMQNIGLLMALAFNTILHLVYGNESAFLYSLHFNYILLLLMGINLHQEENKMWKKISIIFLCVFAGKEIITNNIIFIKVLNYVKDVINTNYLVANLGLPITIVLEILILLIISLIIYSIYWLYKKMIIGKGSEKKVVGLAMVLLLGLGIEGIFIGLESAKLQNQFLLKHLEGKSGVITPKEKENYLSKDFKREFEEELQNVENYKEEIKKFQEEYDSYTIKDTNWTDYYYFGMANRRKLVYRPNKLIDIETKKVIKEFQEKEHFIIPNTYTVLIKTIEDDYIMIKEDESGVHFIVNGKDELIEKTDTKINLYSFENQKYQNMLKVLYGEILFNIKDGVIYPNIIVYNSPWYRDAAITSMVLKKTNNTDLIKDWVNSITELYDKQNGGVEEADNLGELLFLLSIPEERNEELISRVETEAERLAKENPNGYYLYGKTDFGDQYKYQNLWYKLGIESVGRTYHFDFDSIPEDSYSKMAWWSEYETQEKSAQKESSEYPYLSYATRHKLGVGKIPINGNLYPLSWEIVASQANYEAYRGLDDYMATAKVSPLHSWSASELLLLLYED